MKTSGNLYIVASPSGGGKTSLVKSLLKEVLNIDVSISHTTRPRRPYEKDGKDYYFVDEHTFLDMADKGAFIEHANVFGHHYGTSKAQLLDKLSRGIDVLLDIDWQGADQLKKIFDNVVTVFILPPSLTILEERLRGRGQDAQAVIDKRMQQAKSEVSHYDAFDYLVVNEIFEQALAELKSIIYANRLKTSIQRDRYKKLLSNFLD